MGPPQDDDVRCGGSMFLLPDDHHFDPIYRDFELHPGEEDKNCIRLHRILFPLLCLLRYRMAGSSGMLRTIPKHPA